MLKKTLWKRYISTLAVVLAAFLLLSGCMSTIVVGKVNGKKLTMKDIDFYVNGILWQYGMTRADVTDVEMMKQLNQDALDMAVIYRICMTKAKEKGFYPLSEADQKEIDDGVQEYIDYQLEMNTTDLTDSGYTGDIAAEAQRLLNEQFKQYDFTKEDIKRIYLESKLAQLLMDDAVKDVVITDEAIQAEYDSMLAEQKGNYDKDASLYEDDLSNGVTIVYQPAGYRYIKHILINMPEDIATQIEDAQSAGDDTKVKQLREEGLPQIKTKADEVLAKVKGGGDFDTLMAEYGGDPGMQQEPESKTGYAVGSATPFVEEFKNAAMALVNVGDTSELVASDYGYHIIKWISSVPAGALALDTVKESIQSSMLDETTNSKWEETIEQWKTEAKVETYPEKLVTIVSTPIPGSETTAP